MWRIGILCIAWTLVPSTVAGQFPQRVGTLGDPSILEVRGAKTFKPSEIHSVLISKLDVIVAAHRLGLLDDYLSTLKVNCVRGYRHAGFADVKVEVQFDKKRELILLTIDEGARYMAGDIVVTGNRLINGDAIIAKLRQRRPKKKEDDRDRQEYDDPIWQPGEPASFRADGEQRWRSAIKHIFANLGFHDATFKYSVHPHRATGTARLHLDVVDEGRPAIVKSVNVIGLKKNTRAALLKHIAWKPDTLITQAELDRVERALWKSGRFLTQSVTLAKPASLEDSYRLRIEVLEYEPVPPLGEALSRAENVLLKSRDWLAGFDRQEYDIVCQVDNKDFRIEAIMSSKDGLLITAFKQTRQHKEQTPTHTLAISRSEFGYYSRTLGENFAVERIPLKSTLSISATGSAPESPGDSPFAISFGAGAKYDAETKSAPPLEIVPKFDPVFFLGIAHQHEAKATFEDGTLIIKSKKDTLHLDVETGRPMKLVGRNSQGGSDWKSELTTRKGAYATRWAETLATKHATKNRCDPKGPLSSLLLFVSDPRVWKDLSDLFGLGSKALKPDDLASLESIRKLIGLGILTPLDDYLATHVGKSPDRFKIPLDFSRIRPNAAGLSRLIGEGLCPAADGLFARGTWPHTLWQQSCLTLAGYREHTMREVENLYRDESLGPVGHLVTARLLTFVSDDLSDAFARRGLRRLTLEDFRNEYSILLDREYPIGQCTMHMARIVRRLEARDLSEAGAPLRTWHGSLQNPSITLKPEHARELLDLIWTTGLRDRLKEELERLVK